MKQRTIVELLNVLLDNKDIFIYHYSAGLCRYIYLLYASNIINSKELRILDLYLEENKPDIFEGIPDDILPNVFWFNPWEWQPREDWIKSRIKYEST